MTLLLHSAAAQDASSACPLESAGTATVVSVRDGRTLVLDDGREARLVGLEIPFTGDTGAERAKTALTALVANRTVTLKRTGATQDRYGRSLVYAFVTDGGTERSVQDTMLSGGFARVSANAGPRVCAEALLAQEKAARHDRRGLWSADDFGPQPAEKPVEISARRGHFAVIEGKVLSVRESRGVLYMNFGRRYTRDFTVTILKRNERIFTAAGIEPRKLEGKRVRVRGWIEQRGGPVVEATRPEQIELAELNR